MNSQLLAIGCDEYDHLGRLHGAESDARNVFNVLTAAGQRYTKATSRLLLSPTRTALDEALRGLCCAGNLEVLTLYFAGHGATREGSYYFALRDTRAELLSVTGFPLNTWLNIVKELRPRYAYLIVDACSAGGSHHDIRDLLNDPRLGSHTASTFAFLAAASADQYAKEIPSGGVMTAELVKVLDGRVSAEVNREELDLLDVARVVNDRLSNKTEEQRPISWGLNLFGLGRLCVNPHYSDTGRAFHIPEIPAGSVLAGRIRTYSDELWDEYREAAEGLNAPRLRSLVDKISRADGVAPAERSVLVLGLANAFCSRLESRDIPWEMAETLGVFATTLLRDMRNDITVAAVVRELLERKTRMELSLIPQTLAKLQSNPKFLLNIKASMADFFYLPIRLTKLLAVIANALITAEALGLPFRSSLNVTRELVKVVLANYTNSLLAVSDRQAATAYVWFKFARQFGWTDELEMTFGCIFSDLVLTGGRIARGNMEPEVACEYCMTRGRDPLLLKQEWLANPSQLIPVLLLVAGENDFNEMVDPHLSALDHRRLNLFFPVDYADFAAKVIERGVNRSHHIGHDLWSVADFMGLFATDAERHWLETTLPITPMEGALVTLAAQVYPDRIPLHLQRPPPEAY